MKRLFLTFLSVGITLMPTLALASEEAKKGLPQMEVSTFVGQLFWLALSFATLYVLMYGFALPRVSATQEKRHTILETDLGAAKDQQAKAEQVMAEYEKALVSARALAHGTMTDMMFEANKKASAATAVKQEEVTKLLSDAEKRINEAKNKALVEAQSHIGTLADALFDKVTQETSRT